MTNANDNFRRLTAADVLRRYKDEDLPAFCGVPLEDVNQVGNFGERPLDVASARGNMEEIAALLEAGARINAPGELGYTPLHMAVAQGRLTATQFLLDHGADPNVKNEFGETPLDTAKRAKQDDILKALQNRTGGPA